MKKINFMKNVKNLLLLFVFFINLNLTKSQLIKEDGIYSYYLLSKPEPEPILEAGSCFFKNSEQYYSFDNKIVNIYLNKQSDLIFLNLMNIKGKLYCVHYIIFQKDGVILSMEFPSDHFMNAHSFRESDYKSNIEMLSIINFFNYFFNILKKDSKNIKLEFNSHGKNVFLKNMKKVFAEYNSNSKCFMINKDSYMSERYNSLKSLKIKAKSNIEQIIEEEKEDRILKKEYQRLDDLATFTLTILKLSIVFVGIVFIAATVDGINGIKRIYKLKQKEKDNNKKKEEREKEENK